MYGINPFSAQDATKDVDPSHTPSIFGALPYPGTASSVNPPLHTLVTFRFTSFNPTILNCKVVGPNNETCYHVVTGDGQGDTLLKDGPGHTIAHVAWQAHPTVEAQIVRAQPVGQWLQLSSDRSCVSFEPQRASPTDHLPCSARRMIHGGIHYAWAPHDRFLHVRPLSFTLRSWYGV